jgi:hypothetical protein
VTPEYDNKKKFVKTAWDKAHVAFLALDRSPSATHITTTQPSNVRLGYAKECVFFRKDCPQLPTIPPSIPGTNYSNQKKEMNV